MRRRAGEGGQATVELAGIVLLVAVLMSAVAAVARPDGVGEAVAAKLRCALGDGCERAQREPAAVAAGAERLDPALRAWVRADYERDPVLHPGRDGTAPTAVTAGLREVVVCGAAIAFVVASAAIAPARVVQLVRFVRAVGGVRWAATLLTRATTVAEKLAVLRRYIKEGATLVLGIEAIREKC